MLPTELEKRTIQLQNALDFELKLKSITEKICDRLDEGQILQIAVKELALLLKVDCCRAGIYDVDRTFSSIRYEYDNATLSSQVSIVLMADFPYIYSHLLEGEYCQFCQYFPETIHQQAVILACPINDRQGVLGDLWLYHYNDQAFNVLEIQLVQQVATACARAIRIARKYQSAIAKLELLENSNSLKDDFLNTVCHELRTPISNIKMAIQLLEITLNKAGLFNSNDFQIEGTSTPAFRYFRILRDECDRGIGLIEELLDLQRLEAGYQLLELTEIPLKQWISQLIEPFEDRTRKHHQILQVDISPDLPLFLVSDAFSLDRILRELLNNACKYTPQGETITVAARIESGTIQLSVSNSGVEIPADDLHRIFEKFYRVSCLDRWKEGGTGLGLSLVKRLTEYLGGTIQVNSSSNRTCFILNFPLNKNIC